LEYVPSDERRQAKEFQESLLNYGIAFQGNGMQNGRSLEKTIPMRTTFQWLQYEPTIDTLLNFAADQAADLVKENLEVMIVMQQD
jgi:hypothetical protein